MSLLGILMVQIGFAQQKTITGTITDESGIPLPGATVVIENTTRGVSSDFVEFNSNANQKPNVGVKVFWDTNPDSPVFPKAN